MFYAATDLAALLHHGSELISYSAQVSKALAIIRPASLQSYNRVPNEQLETQGNGQADAKNRCRARRTAKFLEWSRALAGEPARISQWFP